MSEIKTIDDIEINLKIKFVKNSCFVDNGIYQTILKILRDMRQEDQLLDFTITTKGYDKLN